MTNEQRTIEEKLYEASEALQLARERYYAALEEYNRAAKAKDDAWREVCKEMLRGK